MAKGNVELLPDDGPEASADTSVDVSNIRVNFSDDESSSEAMDFEAMPTGKYHIAITDGEIRRSNSEKHNGKPYWALTLTVQNGPYENRKLWANVMLFEGALYSLAQLMKATGREEVLKTGNIPSLEEILGEECIVSVVKALDKYKMERDGTDEKLFKNEVKGFKSLDSAGGTSSSSGSSLLP